MRRKFGALYEKYAARTSMFIPGGPGGRLCHMLFPDRVRPADKNAILDVGTVRTVDMLADMDASTHRIFLVKKLSGLTKWGRLPMPVF